MFAISHMINIEYRKFKFKKIITWDKNFNFK